MKNSSVFQPVTYREYQFESDFPCLLMHGNQISLPSEAEFLHFHNAVEIAMCERGYMEWNLENRKYTLHPGEVCFLPPFFTHSCRFPIQEEPDVLCNYLFLKPEILPDSFSSLRGGKEQYTWNQYANLPHLFSINEYTDEIALIRMIIDEFSNDPSYHRPMIWGLLEALMALLQRRFQDTPPAATGDSSFQLLLPAVSWLDQKYASDPDIDHLAQLCGLSRTRFLHEFRESFHQTPLQYLRVLRVQKACYLLTSTEQSVLEILLETGFHSVSSFNRCFQEVTGQSPLAYRRQKRAIVKKDPKYSPFCQ